MLGGFLSFLCMLEKGFLYLFSPVFLCNEWKSFTNTFSALSRLLFFGSLNYLQCETIPSQVENKPKASTSLWFGLSKLNVNVNAPRHVSVCVYRWELFVQILIETKEKVKQWGETLLLDSSQWQSHSQSAAAEQVSCISGQERKKEKKKWQTVQASSFHAFQSWTTTAYSFYFPLNFAFGELWGDAPKKRRSYIS